MPVIQDIDIYGRNNPDGSALEFFEEDAIKNSITLWISSKKGDFILNPSEGGILDNFLFKNLRAESLNLARVQLINSLTQFFGDAINLDGVDIFPDYETRTTQLEIRYTIITNKKQQVLNLYLDNTYENQKFDYEEVTYTEFNLYNFFLVKKPDNSQAKLIYDEEGFWKWGRFKIVNLTMSDPYFDDILNIANNA